MSRLAVEFRAWREGDAEDLGARLRQQDVDELLAGGHTDMVAVLRQSLAQSEWALAVEQGGKLVALFGLASGGTVLVPFGVPWMLGSDEVATGGRVLVAQTARYISAMLRRYDRLFNCVHARNTVAIGWLRHVGFRIGKPFPHPKTGELFHPFEMTDNV